MDYVDRCGNNKMAAINCPTWEIPVVDVDAHVMTGSLITKLG